MKKLFIFLLVIAMMLTMVPTALAVGNSNVAKVGNTEYATIDEAIANWTNGTTLTLLTDVTLSDAITLKSTEHHILNLGTYTMTASSGKNAIVIQACGTGDSERSAITINADAANPGGINAGNKSIIYYKYADGGISGNDRPIIKINGGVFTGSTSSWGTAGIYTIGTAARKCATLNIDGGTFNCSINGSGKSKLIISGGTFNYSVGSQGDSTALRLISGGTFKTFGFMTADSKNTKFWIGTKMAVSDVGVYVDDNGYLVVGGSVITEPGTQFKASSKNYSGFNSYLQYSSANKNGLYYTSVEEALADNKKATGEVTVYVDELNLSSISNFKGTIILAADETSLAVPENFTGKIKLAEGVTKITAPAGLTVETDKGNSTVVYSNGEYNVVPTYKVTLTPNGGTINAGNVEQYAYSVGATLPTDVTKTGYTFNGWYGDEEFNGDSITAISTTDSGDKTFYAKWTPNNYTVTFDNNSGEGSMANQSFIYNDEQALTESCFTKTGYKFTGWNTSPDGSGTPYADKQSISNLSAENSANVTLYAQWTINQYTITFMDGESEIGKITQDYGTDVAPPAAHTKEGYTFAGWLDENGDPTEVPTTMPAENLIINAQYIKLHAVTVKVTAGGSVVYTIDDETTPYKLDEGTNYIQITDGQTATLTVTPDVGHVVTNVTINGSKMDIEESYAVSENSLIDITFKKVHTITVNSTEGGSVSYVYSTAPSAEPVSFGSGTNYIYITEDQSAIITVTPDEDYVVTDVAIDETKQEIGNTYTVGSSCVMNVIFKEVHVITVTSNENGSVVYSIGDETTPLDMSEGKNYIYAVEGDTVILDITPDSGYKVNSVKIDDESVSDYTIENISDDVAVDIAFKRKSSGHVGGGTGGGGSSNSPAKGCTHGVTCVLRRFTDIPDGAWYFDGVHYCVENGLMNGVSETEFAPKAGTSRAMIVTILWRMAGEPVVNSIITFDDVEADEWYTEAIRWAAAEGIVDGYSEDEFGPNDDISREQLATILWRYAKYMNINTSGESADIFSFEDAEEVSDWALPAMQWACSTKMIEGKPGNLLDPIGGARRCEAATLMMRFCETILK